MKAQKYLSSLLLLLVCPLSLFSQDLEDRPAVKALAKVSPEGIKLRWAPNSPILWIQANKYGYKMEKYLILKDGNIQKDVQKIDLKKDIFKPKPLAEWDSLANKEDYAAIAAQAIYGETFELSNNYDGDISQIVNKTKEQDMRFTFALMASDFSLKTAEYSGLYALDSNAVKGEKYLYKIYANLPPEKTPADTAFVYIGLEDFKDLPQPIELEGQFGNQTVLLSWNYLYFQGIYTAYQIERSEDGKDYQSVYELPVSNPATSQPSYAQRLMFKVDSLPQNYKTYYYRVRGLDAFGDIGPPSKPVEGQGIETSTSMPQISQSEIIKNQKVILEWDFKEEDNELIQGFYVEKAKQANALYQAIHKNLLPQNQRKYEDKLSAGVSYYRVSAIDKQGQKVSSFPRLIQIPDSIPPMPPSTLAGKIDTTGLVRLTWQKPKDDDVQAYRVYRANSEKVEFTQITISPIQDTIFIDSLSLDNLTKEVYYKVVALDEYHNHSDFSEVKKLTKPDRIPPTSPIFQNVKASEVAVELSWVVSSSTDTKSHLLYRHKKDSTDWILIAKFPTDSLVPYDRKQIIEYADTSAIRGQLYQYTVIALDQSGLESKPAKPVSSQKIDRGLREGFKRLTYQSNPSQKTIDFTWRTPTNKVEKYLIYRAEDEAPLRLYKSVSGEKKSWQDTKVQLGHEYQYRLQIIYQDGGRSKFTKEIKMNF